MGSGNSEGIYSVINWNWEAEPPYDTPVRWHTGDPETDPWEWRMRVLDENRGIAYGKFFFGKSGYITEEWFPYFLAARRGAQTLEEAYEMGEISRWEKLIYDIVAENGAMPVHAIKAIAGIQKEDKTAFDKALVSLQGKLYLVLCGRQQKLSKNGWEYGWSSTMLCTPEVFWGSDVFRQPEKITREEAAKEITEQVYKINPLAKPRKINKFILG